MPTCFVSTPAGPQFDAYYREVLVRAILRSGLQPVRADDLDHRAAITERIPRGVFDASVSIADLTGRSAAVLYVLGLAQGMGKPVVLLAQNPADIPYDLRLSRFILYRPGTARWEDMLSLQLEAALREAAT